MQAWTRIFTRFVKQTVTGKTLHSVHTMTPRLTVSPSSALMDSVCKIKLSGISPNKPVTLVACLNEDGNEFCSHAFYTTDSEGCVDVSNMSSHGGSYSGVEEMGLFWSMKPSPGQRKGIRLVKRDVTTPICVDLYALPGHQSVTDRREVVKPACEAKTLRWYMGNGVKRSIVRDGRLRGSFFTPPGKGPFPAVIDLYGTSGGLVEFRAALLASRGIAAFALAYFGYDDLPEGLSVELEYFLEALDWLEKQPEVDRDRLGTVGISKGGEIAMTLASEDRRVHNCVNPEIKIAVYQIKAAVSINCTSYRHTGDLSYKGKVYPSAIPDVDGLKTTEDGFNFLEFYSNSTGQEEAKIEVEKSENAQFLFITSGDDQQCRPEEGQYLSDRMTSHGKKNFKWLCFPGAGHLLEPPYLPMCSVAYHKMLANTMVTGGNTVQHCKAQEQAWPQILNVLHNMPEHLPVRPGVSKL